MKTRTCFTESASILMWPRAGSQCILRQVGVNVSAVARLRHRTSSGTGSVHWTPQQVARRSYATPARPPLVILKREGQMYRSIRWAILGLVLSAGLPSMSSAQSSDTEQFDALQNAWRSAAIGSTDERRLGEGLRTQIEQRVGQEALQEYRAYLAAPIGTQEEEQALRHAIELAANEADIREARAQEMLEAYFSVELHELTLGAATALPPISAAAEVSEIESVEFEVVPSIIPSGGAWAVAGVVRNHSDLNLFIPEARPTLEVTPPLSRLLNADGESEFVRSPPPGRYEVNGLVPYSAGLPRGADTGQRLTASTTLDLHVGLEGMLLFAWAGGLVVLLLQTTTRKEEDGRQSTKGLLSEIGRGFLVMTALVAVVVTISDALEGVSVLPHLSIETRPASVASGMLIQLLGFHFFAPIIKGASQR